MSDPQVLAALIRKVRRKTSILSDEEVAVAARAVREMLRASLGNAVDMYLGGQRSEDIVRWSSLMARCEEERNRRGLSIRGVSLRLGIPQYRLRAIESGGLDGFAPEMAHRYFEFLRIEAWLKRWRKANRELAERARLFPMGLGRRVRAKADRRQHSNDALQPEAVGARGGGSFRRAGRAARRG